MGAGCSPGPSPPGLSKATQRRACAIQHWSPARASRSGPKPMSLRMRRIGRWAPGSGFGLPSCS